MCEVCPSARILRPGKPTRCSQLRFSARNTSRLRSTRTRQSSACSISRREAQSEGCLIRGNFGRVAVQAGHHQLAQLAGRRQRVVEPLIGVDAQRRRLAYRSFGIESRAVIHHLLPGKHQRVDLQRAEAWQRQGYAIELGFEAAVPHRAVAAMVEEDPKRRGFRWNVERQHALAPRLAQVAGSQGELGCAAAGIEPQPGLAIGDAAAARARRKEIIRVSGRGGSSRLK